MRAPINGGQGPVQYVRKGWATETVNRHVVFDERFQHPQRDLATLSANDPVIIQTSKNMRGYEEEKPTLLCQTYQ